MPVPRNNLRDHLDAAFATDLFIPDLPREKPDATQPSANASLPSPPEIFELSSDDDIPITLSRPKTDNSKRNVGNDADPEKSTANREPSTANREPSAASREPSTASREPSAANREQHEVVIDLSRPENEIPHSVHIIDSSPPPPRQPTPQSRQFPVPLESLRFAAAQSESPQPFRLSQAPAAPFPPKPELGSLFSEKIALLEQLVARMDAKLRHHKIPFNCDDLKCKLQDTDRRIENFAEPEPAIEPEPFDARAPLIELSSSPSQFESRVFMDYDDDSDIEEIAFSKRPQDAEHSEGDSPDRDDLYDRDDLCNDDPFDDLHNDPQNDNEEAERDLGVSPYFEPVRSQATVVPLPPPPVASHLPNFPWTREVLNVLHTKFGLPQFRPNQAEAVNETLAGRDVAVLMPTGGGKSLCYQLPALVSSGKTKGTSIVISPLISLMEDQVYHLKNRSIRAEALSSRLSAVERSRVLQEFGNGDLQLLYASPEMLNASGAMQNVMQQLYSNGKLARIVIDEAHCVSSWGHDFRPDYLELSKVRYRFANTPIMALTATANERVLLDIIGCLRANPLVLKQSFNRRNLYYAVRPKTANVTGEIIGICRQFRGRTGIVYCNSKRDCEDLAAKMKRAGIAADFYHAGMEQERRSQVQTDWQTGKCQVVCATIAFGMGIDKPDVRFVIHMTLPRNIEGFYQETGRAGRDGQNSQCILFYSYRDVTMLQKMIQSDKNLTFQQKDHHRTLLNRVLQYCENTTDCRRKQVLQYFNEAFDAKDCRMQCDNCCAMRDQMVVSHDMTQEAGVVVQAIYEIGSRQITTQQCIDVLLGRRTAKTKSCRFDELENFASLTRLGPTSVERLVHTLISEEVLQEYAQYNHSRYPQSYLKPGPQLSVFEKGNKRIVLRMASPVGAAVPRKRVRATTARSKRRS